MPGSALCRCDPCTIIILSFGSQKSSTSRKRVVICNSSNSDLCAAYVAVRSVLQYCHSTAVKQILDHQRTQYTRLLQGLKRERSGRRGLQVEAAVPFHSTSVPLAVSHSYGLCGAESSQFSGACPSEKQTSGVIGAPSLKGDTVHTSALPAARK